MELRVYKSEFPKERIGKNNDGGYVICNIPNIKYDVLISGGISNDTTFEDQFLNKFSINSEQKSLVKYELGFDDKESSITIKNAILEELYICLKRFKLNQLFLYYIKKTFEISKLLNK